MANYNPYEDIASLLGTVKRNNEGVSAKKVEDILKSNQVYYRSTYSDLTNKVGKTKEYITSGKAYNDEGAKAIRAAYAKEGGLASGAAAAKGAAENEGNLDSYAAAQANRQRQAFISEGEKAVGERASQVYNAMNAADKNLVSAFDAQQKAMNSNGTALASNAKNASSSVNDALDDLLDYYGILAKR